MLREILDVSAVGRILREPQLAVLPHHAKRPTLSGADRAFWVVLARVSPEWRAAVTIVQPAKVIG